MQNENVKLMSGKIVEELTEADLDERISEVESSIASYEGYITKLEAELTTLQDVKSSI